MTPPRWFWRWIRIGPRLAYAIGLGPLIGRFVLLLTTTGRRSGKRRVTPLVYEETDGSFLVASARGPSADWVQNIAADGRVGVRVGKRRFEGQAEIIHEADPIVSYLERRMDRNPRMFGAIMRLERLPPRPSRADLEELARRRPMVVVRPLESNQSIRPPRHL